MENFIYEYYISPIWDHSGYNVVNTITYAIIAIIAVYLLNKIIKKAIMIDENFITGVMAFVLFGSTIRTVTDAIGSGIFQPVSPVHEFVLNSHWWDYGYLTVTPGIYVVTATLLLVSMTILHRLKRMELLPYIGLALWLPHFILLIPFMQYIIYAIPIIFMAFVPTLIAYKYFKNRIFAAIVAGQALDGAATFFAIDIFSAITGIKYFEQHVFSAAIGNFGGTYFTFYLLKTCIAFAAVYLLTKEKMEIEDKYYIAMILMTMGFAPGIRDILRMVIGG